MKILVIFASHRIDGTNAEIHKAMCRYSNNFDFDFIHLANYKVESCVSCHCCGKVGHCILPPSDEDRFQEIFDKMITTDAIFIICPVYATIPSRLTAVFERLTSVLFDTGLMNTDNNPLLNKKTAIFNYCSCGICDDAPIKLIFDKFVMKNYRFDFTTYAYLNQSNNPKEEFRDITEYVTKTLEQLI
ncbi:MAG: flavodoxin family protein [Eubacteriales bacterium]|nr:flavodoxin family protein [Eubacteriales bacterium]